MTQNKTKRLVVIAMLSAIAAVLMQFTAFPLLAPPLDFLQVDASIVLVLFGLFILGAPSAYVILLLRSVIYLLLFNSGVSTMIGVPMNITAMALYIFFVSLTTRKSDNFTIKQFAVGGILGTFALTIAMLLLNYFYAIPMYERFANFRLEFIGMTRIQYLIYGVIPFNVIQGILLTVINIVCLTPMKKLIAKQNRKFVRETA